MKHQKFNFEEVFNFAWAKTKQHAWFLACSFMIYGIIMSASMDVVIFRGEAFKAIGFFGSLVAALIALSLMSISLIIVRNESFSFADLFNRLKSPRLVTNFLGLTILYVGAISCLIIPFLAVLESVRRNGSDIFASSLLLVLFVITAAMFALGIYGSIRFKFYPYVLLENEYMTIVEVIKHTKKITCCAFISLFSFFIILAVINVLGFLAFGVGLLITVPISVFAVAHLYRKLEGHVH